MLSIDFSHYTNIVFLTGAGVSVASGIRPFRGPGGLWEEFDPAIYADRAAIEKNPLPLWQLMGSLRTQLKTAQPNPAHIKIAELESQLLPQQQFTLITQNIDGLHQRAGSRNVIEVHGSVHWTRCSNLKCGLARFLDDQSYQDQVPLCSICHAPLRPDIVLFREPLPVEAEWRSKQSLRTCDLFIAIGTSGVVSPASNFVHSLCRRTDNPDQSRANDAVQPVFSRRISWPGRRNLANALVKII
jgi:NAD-dependent deacetylase